jgi:hypothetical protein
VSTSIIQTQLQALRLKYNAVYTAYRGCVEALGKVSIEGETPSADLLQKEALRCANSPRRARIC